jgi:hypothetical protein
MVYLALRHGASMFAANFGVKGILACRWSNFWFSSPVYGLLPDISLVTVPMLVGNQNLVFRHFFVLLVIHLWFSSPVYGLLPDISLVTVPMLVGDPIVVIHHHRVWSVCFRSVKLTLRRSFWDLKALEGHCCICIVWWLIAVVACTFDVGVLSVTITYN